MPDEFDTLDGELKPGVMHELEGGGVFGYMPLSMLPEPEIDTGEDSYTPVEKGPQPNYGAVGDPGAEEPGMDDGAGEPPESSHPPAPPAPAEEPDPSTMPEWIKNPFMLSPEQQKEMEEHNANGPEPDPSRGPSSSTSPSVVYDE